MSLVAALMLASMMPDSGVTSKFIGSGATAKTGGYSPIRAELGADPGTLKKPSGLKSPKFGEIKAGSKSFAFILDEETNTLFIDSNGDKDLTNDPVPQWAPRKQGTATMYFGNGSIQLSKAQSGAINFYKFDPNDPQRAALKNTILYYYDFGYEVTYKLDGKESTSFISGFPSDKSRLNVDRNSDGKISSSKETFTVGKAFNFTGTTYVLNFKDDKFSLDIAKEKLPVSALPGDFRVGKQALAFKSPTLDGGNVNFPNDYKGKIVMLDFWATWCGPCLGELPNVKAAYAKWHSQGFEVLSLSFDDANMTDKLKDFTAKNGMDWRHVYEGKGWGTTIGEMYDVNAIPFVLLVDGDTGQILGDASNLRGPGIVDFVGKVLAKKKGN